MPYKNKKKRNEYNKKYNQRPEVKLKIQKYKQQPHIKERKRMQEKIHQRQPEVKSRKKEYNQRPENKKKRKEYMKKYNQRPEVIKKIKNYEQQPHVKERKKKYSNKYRQQLLNKKRKKIIDRKYNQRPEIKIIRNLKEKQRREKDINFYTLHLIRTNFLKAMKKYSTTGKINSLEKYGLNTKLILEHLGEKPKDGNEYQLDHIIPASWFDHNNPQEIKWCWAPENLQWLRKDINLWKNNRFILISSLNKQKVKQ